MSTAQISFMPLFRRLDRVATEWHRLIDRALDGYRPERHYMRGPGPKWHAKHHTGQAFCQPSFDGFLTQRRAALRGRACGNAAH